jgi:hypothetical protein
MHFQSDFFLMKVAVIALFLCRSLSADTASGKQEEEISWDKASTQVDSFPFSSAYIDSIRDTLDCPAPLFPLRVIKDYTAFAPETLVYTIAWGPFNAGYVILTTLYDSTTKTILVGGKALSNNFVGTFYKMRDYVISTIDAKGLYPLFFEQHLREGKKYKSNEYLLFDYEREKIYVKTRKKFKTIDSTGTFIHDYLSVLHLIRATRKLAPGDTFSERLFVHDKVHSIFFSVSASKPKECEAGKFPCVILTPRLAGEGRAFNKKDKLEIWISDDKRRIPVGIRSKIKFGSIDARLIWINKKKVAASK